MALRFTQVSRGTDTNLWFVRRVATLLIEADREIIGQIHDGSGNVHLGTTDHPQSDDLLDDLGERVLKMGGQVFVVPAERMPTATGAAAICRY